MNVKEHQSQVFEEFVNNIISDLLKVVHDGFGGASQFRCYLVGRALLNYVTANLNLNNLGMMGAVKKVLEFMKESRIFDDAELFLNEPVMELHFHNCRFSPIAKKLNETKTPLFACPCANVYLGLIEDKFGLGTEIMSIKQEENICKVKILLFK